MRNNNLILNVYEKNNSSSKLASQLLFGDSFDIIKKYKYYYKIKCKFDKYIGFVKRKKYSLDVINTHKIKELNATLYKRPSIKYKLKSKISFCSLIKVSQKNKDFFKFDNFWIKKKDVVPINKGIKDINKIKIFLDVPYKWGGNTYKGLDCSALLQLYYKYNNEFFPRDTKEQMKFLKKSVNIKNIKKNNLIFWKGHVAICLSNKILIHAYGPKKKVIIMNIKKTINEIEKKSKLKVKFIKNASN